MKYMVKVGDARTIEVVLDGDGVTSTARRSSRRSNDVEGTPVRMVTIGDEVHRVVARRGATRGRYTLWLDGYRFEVEALDERTRAIRELIGGVEGTDRSGAAHRADAGPDRSHRASQVGEQCRRGRDSSSWRR